MKKKKLSLQKHSQYIKNILHFVFLALSAGSNDQDTLRHAVEKSVSPWVPLPYRSLYCYITFVCKHSTDTPFRAAQSNNADVPPPCHFWQPIGLRLGRCVCDWLALSVALFGLAVSPCGLAVLLTYFLSEKGRAAVGGSLVHVIWIGLSLLSVKVELVSMGI